jgi:hypothetical protein
MNGRQVQLGLSRSATAGIKDQETRVRALFRLINALVVPKLGSNVVLLSKWKATKAITHTTVTPVPAVPATPVVPATPDTPAATTPAATPAATTTPTTTTSAAEAAPPQV